MTRVVNKGRISLPLHEISLYCFLVLLIFSFSNVDVFAEETIKNNFVSDYNDKSIEVDPFSLYPSVCHMLRWLL